ncbi:MAG: hypothetical protein M0Z83_00330 [Betaproteobacteria bacterium]|nr:hypothetical protein [Betaproteobacteria bacterium]
MSSTRTHQTLDRRSLALHRIAVKNVLDNPLLFNEIRKTLDRWLVIVAKSSQPYVRQWDDLANQGIDVFLAKAVEESEDGNAMRQSSPFGVAISNKERSDFFKNWKCHDQE